MAQNAPWIIAHNPDHARAAAEAARKCDAPLTLASPPGAIDTLGPEVFMHMMRDLSDRLPEVRLDWVLDCGDAPGFAMAALRAGVPAIALDGPEGVLVKIQAIADQQGARLAPPADRKLDLMGEPDPGAAVEAFLSDTRSTLPTGHGRAIEDP